MSDNQPQEHDEPQIFVVNQDDGGKWQFTRRDFLKAAGIVGAVGALVVGKKSIVQAQPLRQGDYREGHAHSTGVTTVTISLDGTLLVSGGFDKMIKLWSLPEGALLQTLEVQEQVRSIALSPDKTLLVVVKYLNNTLELWSLSEGVLLQTLEGHTDEVQAIAISSDGTLLVSGGKDQTLKLWSLPDGMLLRTLEGHTDQILSVAISSDGTLLASGGWDQTIKLWSLPDGILQRTLENHSLVTSVAISPDGEMLASVGWPGIVNLWSLPDGALLRTNDSDPTISLVAFGPDGILLATGNRSQSILLLSLRSRPKLRFLRAAEGHTAGVYSIAGNRDGTLLVSGSSDCKLKLWSLPDGEYIKDLIDIAASGIGFDGIQYSPGDMGEGMVTLACGSLLPEGEICSCNCVQGTYCSCHSHSPSGNTTTYWYPN